MGVPYQSNFIENREPTIAWNADKSDFFYITHRNLQNNNNLSERY